MKKEELNELKSNLEKASKDVNIKRKEFSQIEENAEDKFEENIKGFVFNEKYENIEPYLKIITDLNTRINCFVLKGEQGIGKSTIIKNLMKNLNKDFAYLNSYTTSLAFYKFLYYNRHKHIILDDVFGLYESEKGISILRAVTNTEKVRYVKYESTSDKLDVPSSFLFEGSITILTNKITDKMDKSLLDRAIFRSVNFSLKEKKEFIDKIIEFNYPQIDNTKEIIEFIKNNVNDTTKNFSFRSVLRICEFYIHNKEKWKELSEEEIKQDEELVFVKEIMSYSTKLRNQKWIEETGLSVRTLRRRIKELKNRTKGQRDKNA